MRRWNEVCGITPIIGDVLTPTEVWDLFDKSCDPRYSVAVFKDTTFETPDGQIHEGCLVQRGRYDIQYLFMERTWKEVKRYRHCVGAVPVWHKLLDITHLISSKTAREVQEIFRTEQDIHDRELFNKMTIVVHSVPGKPLIERMESTDVENIYVFKRPENECIEFDRYVEETVKGLIDGTITPFDDRWVDLLMGELQREKEVVFGALRNKGHVIYEIVGEDAEKNRYKGISLDGINVTGWQHCK
ncbi:MAG: hypothetical protein NC548_41330 [Lachnospiraceae bacterium]|nr:hypothetical protein [Lachnospiraceae bacterium]